MNSYLQFIFVFIATLIGDVCWTKYIQHVNAKKAFNAAIWNSAIYVMGAFVVISYNINHWYVIAAFLGGFVGTYYTVRHSNK